MLARRLVAAGHTVVVNISRTVIALARRTYAQRLELFDSVWVRNGRDVRRTIRVIRDGVRVNVPARELVPGDVVLLEAGNFIPADVRLVETVNLRVEEAALTHR